MPIWHAFKILVTVVRYRLDTILLDFAKEHWLRWLLPSKYIPSPKSTSAVRLREALQRLGPIYIKFGQILSTRRDLLPADYADELAKLQDRVPPFPVATAIETIESSLGAPVSTLFQHFDQSPIASASLAQVHGAQLPSGEQVVVKVIRPDIEKQINNDLSLVHDVAKVLEWISYDARRLHLTEIVDDYEQTILGELDLVQEGKNTSVLRYNFANSPLLYAPRVYQDLTTRDVLVMERIYGVSIADINELKRLGTDLPKLAVRGVETFFTQVFIHNFFHADMHPGNIFVDIDDPKNPSYIAVDCAIIGQLTEEDQTYLARNIVAFFNRDYAEIASLHAASGWIAADTDTKKFEEVIKELCDPLFEKPLAQISFGHFLLNLFRTAREFRMEVQPQLVLLQKTLLNVEGMGRQLDPDLDLWATAKPFMERWMKDRFGPVATLVALLDRAPSLLLQLPELPNLLVNATNTVSQLRSVQRKHKAELELIQSTNHETRRRRKFKQVFGVLLLALAAALLWRPTTQLLAHVSEPLTIGVGVVVLLVGAIFILKN